MTMIKRQGKREKLVQISKVLRRHDTSMQNPLAINDIIGITCVRSEEEMVRRSEGQFPFLMAALWFLLDNNLEENRH